MTEIEKKSNYDEMTDDQLEEVTGGATVQPMGFKYCAADPTHVYVHIHRMSHLRLQGIHL